MIPKNKIKSLLILILSTGLLVACGDDDDDDSSSNSSLSINCTIDENDVYDIGTDVTSDFDVSNVNAVATVTATDCPGVEVGDAENYTESSIERSGNSLIFGSVTLTISGTDIQETELSASGSGCTVTQTVSGQLDTTNDEVELDISSNFMGTCLSGELEGAPIL